MLSRQDSKQDSKHRMHRKHMRGTVTPLQN
jgi:hypothetical protein